jgi:hypothetical protein
MFSKMLSVLKTIQAAIQFEGTLAKKVGDVAGARTSLFCHNEMLSRTVFAQRSGLDARRGLFY